MTTFLDGPAADQTLMLYRTPRYLRITRNGAMEWDALSELTDVPKPDEELFAYYRAVVGKPIHLRWYSKKEKRTKSGWWQLVDYKFITAQPSDEIMRSTEKWRAWCETENEIRLQKETEAHEAKATDAPAGPGVA